MNTWKDIRTLTGRLALLGLLVIVLWVASIFVAVNMPRKYWEYWRRNTNIMLGVGQRGGSSMIRFHEIEKYHDVDVVFIGSSHSYRSFDPRIFDSLGLQTFNMGSRNQNLVNSYYLLKDHLHKLNPRLLLIEVYWDILGGTGLESYFDLAENYPSNLTLVEMLWGLRDIRAADALLARWLEVNRPPYAATAVNLMPKDRYVGRGYVEKDPSYDDSIRVSPYRDAINRSQLRYLADMIKMAKDQGAKVALVVQPLPGKRLAALQNREEVTRRMQTFAKSHDVPYLDFNELMNLRDDSLFFDSNHLTQHGVELFDHELIRQLNKLNLLPVDGRIVSDTK